jgi:hypothetical protein
MAMFFKLMTLDRSGHLCRQPQFFEHYPDALAAAGESLKAIAQGSTVEIVRDAQVVLRMFCEKSPRGGMAAALMSRVASGQEAPTRH